MACRDAGQEMEVVLEHDRRDGLRGHIDDASPRVAKPRQQEEQGLLPKERVAVARELARLESDGRYYHAGVGRVFVDEDVLPERRQTRLEPLEGLDLLLGRKVLGYAGHWGQRRRAFQVALTVPLQGDDSMVWISRSPLADPSVPKAPESVASRSLPIPNLVLNARSFTGSR